MADFSVSSQVYVFFAMILLGVICGAVFDVFRGIRRMRKVTSGVVAMQDLFFWITELALVYIVTFNLSYARVRGFELIALFIGSIIYFMTVSVYVIAFVYKTANYVRKITGRILKPVLRIWVFVKSKLSLWALSIRKKTIQSIKKLIPYINIKQKITELFVKRYKLLKKRVK